MSNEQTGAQVEAPKTQLTLNHIATMVSVISTAQGRGAFKAEEMVVVGTLYSDLVRFLNESKAADEAAAQAAEEAEAAKGEVAATEGSTAPQAAE